MGRLWRETGGIGGMYEGDEEKRDGNAAKALESVQVLLYKKVGAITVVFASSCTYDAIAKRLVHTKSPTN